jgi:hypothetical protein
MTEIAHLHLRAGASVVGQSPPRNDGMKSKEKLFHGKNYWH